MSAYRDFNVTVDTSEFLKLAPAVLVPPYLNPALFLPPQARERQLPCGAEELDWAQRLIGYQRLGIQAHMDWLDSLHGDLLRP